METETAEKTQPLVDKGLMKVLLVEDDAADRKLVQRLLAKRTESVEFAVESADSLSAAIEHLGNGEYDVVLLDLGLPDSVGIDTVRKIREVNAQVPVVVLTGMLDETVGVSAIKNGAMDYLIKGVSLENLLIRTILHALERKRMEAKLNDSMAKLEQSNADLEQFAYVASHDLQEPLRMVESYLQLLQQRYKDKLDRDADEFIEYAVDGAERMRTLINDLLTFSRVDTRGKEFAPTNCEEILNQVLSNLQHTIKETGAVVTHDCLPTVMADYTQIGQLLQNLISNAIKFSNHHPPEVHLSAQKNGNEWVFSVRDNGIGIAPEYTEQIFKMFKRLHSRDEYTGTGIGLAVCKKIVERHNGRIWVESEPGKGCTFYFTIPHKDKG